MNKTTGATSPIRMRLLSCCALAAFALAQASFGALAAELPDRCAVPLAWPERAGKSTGESAIDPAEFWENDRQISILRREDGQRFAYRIVGDVVELNATLFPALATAPDGQLSDISELVIDAREIVIDMPLRLSDASISLRADTVRFAGGAWRSSPRRSICPMPAPCPLFSPPRAGAWASRRSGRRPRRRSACCA
jgi:hypothetical protein